MESVLFLRHTKGKKETVMNYARFIGSHINEIPYVKDLKRECYDEYHSLETWYETRYQELYWEVNDNLVEHLRTSNSLVVGRYDSTVTFYR